ncbi:MAG: MFS transporter [Anaerolineae bacterium]
MNLRRLLRQRLSTPRPKWWMTLQLLLAGGRWSANIPQGIRRNLRRMIVGGILENVSDAIVNTYQSVYLLTLGASRVEIGLLSSLSNFAMPVAMLPGGRLATGRQTYKRLAILPSFVGRALLIGLIVLPYFGIPLRLLIYLAIAFAVGRAFLLHFANPAWTALLGKSVPARWRGRYFSARNIFMSGTAFVVLLLIGESIDRLGEPLGYQVALGVAVAAALGAAYTLFHLEEPSPDVPPPGGLSAAGFWKRARAQEGFLRLCTVSTLWSLGVNVASPFFLIFLVERVQVSAATLGVVSAVSTLAALPAQRLFGLWVDRKGTAWVQRLTGFLIPLVPALWSFIRHPWQAFSLQAFGGFVWAGYNLAAFNLLLEVTPEDLRPRFVAFRQSLVGVGMAAGAALGGWIAERWGYTPVFLISAAGRLFAATIFALGMAGVDPRRRLQRLGKKRLGKITSRLKIEKKAQKAKEQQEQ